MDIINVANLVYFLGLAISGGALFLDGFCVAFFKKEKKFFNIFLSRER